MQSFPEPFANRWAAERPNRWPSLIHQVLSVTQSAVRPTPTYSKTQSPTAAPCDEGEESVSVRQREDMDSWDRRLYYYRCGAETLPPSVSDGHQIRRCVFVFPGILHSLTHQTFSHAESPSSCWVIRTLPYIRGRGLIDIWPKERYMHACTYILDGHEMSHIYTHWQIF